MATSSMKPAKPAKKPKKDLPFSGDALDAVKKKIGLDLKKPKKAKK